MYDHFIFQWIATDFNFTDWTDYVKTTGQVLISTVVDKVVFRTHLLIYYCPRLQSWVAMTESMAHKGWNICNFVLYRKFTGSFPCCSVSSYMYCMLFVWYFSEFFFAPLSSISVLWWMPSHTRTLTWGVLISDIANNIYVPFPQLSLLFWVCSVLADSASVDSNSLGWNFLIASILNMQRFFFSFIFPKQLSITIIYVSFTL